MGKLIALNHVTLDGVMQSPARPDEDTRGDFAFGGWAIPDNDEVLGRAMGVGMQQTGGALLLGRRTYEDFYGYWPNQPDNPFSSVLEAAQKYVVSNTLREPLPWANSHLLAGDPATTVAALKASDIGDLLVMGSGMLVRGLLGADLVDRLWLITHPIVLGEGTRMFAEHGARRDWTLVDSVVTTKGVIVATYDRR